MSNIFRKDKAKAACKLINSLLELPKHYKINKILYFAERKHLAKYGRPITNDIYKAEEHGPVPSMIKDFVARDYIGEPDLLELSKSDVECIKEAIERYGDLSNPDLEKESHDDIYYAALKRKDKVVSFVSMAKSEGACITIIDSINRYLSLARYFSYWDLDDADQIEY